MIVEDLESVTSMLMNPATYGGNDAVEAIETISRVSSWLGAVLSR